MGLNGNYLNMLLSLRDSSRETVGSTSGGIARFVTVVIIFLAVLGITYFATRFIAKSQQAGGIGRSANMEVLENLALAPNRFLSLVRIGSLYYVVMVGKDQVLGMEPVPQEVLDLSRKENGKNNFNDILSRMKGKGAGNTGEVSSGKEVDE